MEKTLLKNRVAVVTGASRGIGRDIALCFAREGATVILNCLEDQERLTKVCEEAVRLGTESIGVMGDVSRPEFCESVFAKVADKFGRADILVNCAGMITRPPVEELTLEEWYRVIDVNLHGAFHMCRMFLPGMRKQRYGKIINVTSQMANIPHPSASPSYEVSKAGLGALTRHLALHYAEYNVSVNAIAPGSIDTDMPRSMSDTDRARLKNSVPMKRLGDPREVGECALFLASERSNYITGATLHINGGSLIL